MVSIIMPVRNEIEYITKAINSVLYQSISDDSYEIIAVDGNSTDGTHELLNKLAAEHPHLCLIQNKNKIVSTGFNLALNKAKGKYILRVDGHCELPQNYVEKCQYLLEENNASITGGRIKTVSDGIIGNAISTAQSSFFGVGGVPFRTTAEKKNDES